MMSHHIWKTVDAGVMLWEPAPEAATTQGLKEQLHASEERDVEGEALASSDDAEQEVILPSIEEVFEPPCITTISEQDSSILLFSSPSISFSEKDSTPEASPVLRLDNTLITCSEPFANSNLYEQLEEFAHSPTEDSITLSQSQSSTSSKKTNSIGSQSTPCPPRPTHPESKAMDRLPESRKCKHPLGANTSRPVERKLKFDTKGSPVKTSSAAAAPPPPPLPVKELSNLQSLAALRRNERDPCHSWDEDERELLSVLYRWYNNADPSTIPKVFNAVTGLNLKLSVVRYQFESHILLYGGRAFPEYARVMSVPFDDPQGRYYDIRDIIEETAAESGINLPRRDTEVLFNDGTARYAKSPRTRRTYRALVRKAAQKEKEKARIARRVSQHVEPTHQHVEELAYQKQSGMSYHLGRMTMAVHSDQVDEEDWSEVGDFKTPLSIPEELQFMPSPTMRNIAFRVWDANSRTAFSEDAGFVSQAFTIWRNEYPPPFSFDGQGRQALMILTNLHLSLQGGASTFVSLSTSLLQALVKASTMDSPRIAVVALDHPLLTAPNKTLPAADVLRMLKSEGLAWWARYKGHAERMVWCNVPAEAILSHFPLADLQILSDTDDTCSELLSLSEIRPGKRTRHVSARIQAKNNSIDSIVSARALACIARAFGMHRENVSLEHIQGLVAALVDSLQLMHNNNESPPHSPILSSRITQAFAAKLKSRCHCVESVASAFLSGVRQGTDTIAYYSRRRGRPRSRE